MEVLRRSSVFAAEVMEVFDRSPTDKELVSQAKALCRDYINSRLIRAGVSWSKPEYNVPVPGGKLAEVSTILLRLGDELEYIRPNVYRNIARQLNISLHSETVVTDAFLAVAAQIFTAGITWGKVVSLYAVAAGLAVDCVRHAQPAMVHTIVDCLGEFVRKTLVTWLKRRGGWPAMNGRLGVSDPDPHLPEKSSQSRKKPQDTGWGWSPLCHRMLQPARMNLTTSWTPKTSPDVLPQNPVAARSSRWISTRWCQTYVKGAGCPAHPWAEIPHLFLTHQPKPVLKLVSHKQPFMLLQVFKSQISPLIENIKCLKSWGKEELL
ncbi:bcl-2-related ovarian killer protein isoform X1 [Neopelma chrysocephalum]|uniref:bcl-2-related ovarian killer protein isoform X1 n=1 Tax=Neopelma chrysocephalum TaxID=114329 RepID=UPI000FCCE1E9|nr:bcl-2-related ovarian killer protein isoform X1 [Neopelma chrysocephalum]